MDKRVLLVYAFVHIFLAVNSLQCYQCTNCAGGTSSQLVQCDAATTSAPSTSNSTPTKNSTSSTNNSTSNPINNSTSSTNSSTSNPTNNNTSSTNSSTSNPTNNSTSSTNNSTANTANKTYVPQLHDSKKREVLERNFFYDSEDMRATVDYFCFETIKQINGTDVVDRGCGMKTSSLICIVSDDLKSLKACKTDKCNGAFTEQLPFFTTIIMLSLSFAIG